MSHLPNRADRPFLTDGGIETTLIFQMGFDLPCFASYPLLDSEGGREALRSYYRNHMEIAERRNMGFVLESPTWRCSPDWGAQLGHSPDEIARFNRDAILLMEELQVGSASNAPIVISGNIGPRGDGYKAETMMTAQAARDYHAFQIGVFAEMDVDVVTAITMTHSGEAAGVALAAKSAGIPCVIGFTTETDGRLPSGETLAEAISAVDTVTDAGPIYYMINCAHPDHFVDALPGGRLAARIRGIRANASRQSHAELDDAENLDRGDPHELAQNYAVLRQHLPNLTVFGGCCGTDHHHIGCIADAITASNAAA